MNRLLAGNPTAAIAVTVLALSAGGCRRGPSAPVRLVPAGSQTPTAKIWNTDGGHGTTTYVVTVDGRRVPYKKTPFGHDTSSPVIVPAGVRRLEVTIETRYGSALTGWVFDYNFAAGHSYLLGRAHGPHDRVEVYDETARTGVVVEKPKRP